MDADDSTDSRQLHLWVTRPGADGRQMAELARERGMVPWLMPVMDIFWHRPDAHGLRALMRAEVVVVTSRHALQALSKAGIDLPAAPSWIAVGTATADALAQAGVQAQVPEQMTSEGVLALPALAGVLGRHVCILKGEGGRELLARQLEHAGAQVTEVPLYRRVCAHPPEGMLRTFFKQKYKALVAASGESLACARAAAAQVQQEAALMQLPLAVMSERMARLAAQQGWQGEVTVARETSSAGLLAALPASV